MIAFQDSTTVLSEMLDNTCPSTSYTQYDTDNFVKVFEYDLHCVRMEIHAYKDKTANEWVVVKYSMRGA